MKHYEYEINLFIDNELPAPGQKELFAHLAACNECSALLQKYIRIKSAARDYFAGIDADAANSIMPLPDQKNTEIRRSYKKHFYISAAAAVVLLLLSIYHFYQPDSTLKKNNDVKKEFITSRDIKSHTDINNNHSDTMVFKTGNSPGESSSVSLTSDLKDSKENHLDDIIIHENLFSRMAGDNNIRVIEAKDKGINKYFSGDYVDSPSIIREIKLTGSKNGMTAFEKNIYEQLLSAPSNTLPVDTVIKRASEYKSAFTGENRNYRENVRNLKYHNTPYIDKYGVYHPADSVITRDLFLREGDKHFVKHIKGKKFPEAGDIVKRESGYNDYLNDLKKEKVTQSDFLTPQILGN